VKFVVCSTNKVLLLVALASNWEQEFSQLKPVKRRGNRRYYQRHDVVLIREIRGLLYEQGFTIGGARQQLGSPTETKMPHVAEHSDQKHLIDELLKELQDLRTLLN
jgi:DNA-binding transcriptional MerR regulator